jgi:uncharacterized metal-binding protein
MDFPIPNRHPGCQGWLNWLNAYFPNQLFIKHVAKSAHPLFKKLLTCIYQRSEPALFVLHMVMAMAATRFTSKDFITFISVGRTLALEELKCALESCWL